MLAPAFFGAISVWDSERDAHEFAEAWTEWAAMRDGRKLAEVSGHNGAFRVKTKEGLVVVVAEGRVRGVEIESGGGGRTTLAARRAASRSRCARTRSTPIQVPRSRGLSLAQGWRRRRARGRYAASLSTADS